MSQGEIIKGIVNYFKSDQWQELTRILTQADEQIEEILAQV